MYPLAFVFNETRRISQVDDDGNEFSVKIFTAKLPTVEEGVDVKTNVHQLHWRVMFNDSRQLLSLLDVSVHL